MRRLDPGAGDPGAGRAMSERLEVPEPLAAALAEFDSLDRGLRAEMLIEAADRFEGVPAEVASRPYDEEHRVPRCESEAYLYATDREDGTLKLWFAVENPQGVSAKAWAVILDETLSGQPLEQLVCVPQDVVFRIFGRDVSMGKGQGMVGMLEQAQFEARRRLEQRRREREGL